MKAVGYILICILSYILYSCASVKSPEGGPRDTDEPKLIFVNPDTNQTNFKSNVIELKFNEQVDIVNEKDILIQPLVSNFKTNAKGKKITLTFLDSLKSNTTYTIDFQKSIIDITEKNIAENIFVSFSTGDNISKGNIYGYTKDYFNNEKAENIIIGLFALSDSIEKQKPIYYTKSNKTGEFKLRNIKDGKYFLMAFDDKNNNLKPDISKEKYYFINSEIDIKNDTTKYDIFLINPTPKFKINDIKKYNNQSIIELSSGIKNYQLKGKVIYNSLKKSNSKEITIFHSNTEETDIELSIIDSLNNKIDTTFKLLSLSSLRKLKKVNNKILKYYKSDSCIILEYEKPILTNNVINKLDKIINKKLIKVNDTINKDSIVVRTKIVSKIDTIIKPLKSIININKLHIYTQDTIGEIKLSKNNIMFYDSTYNDSIFLKINTVKPILFSSAEGKIIDTLKNKQYIVQLIVNNMVEYELISTDNKFKFDLINTGDYKLRIIIDENKNNVFDYPNLITKKQAEKIYLHPTIISIKQNWEIKDLIININTVDKPLKTIK